jgi:hypothetical protein
LLFRLAQMGYDAEATANPRADIVACSREGTRVALLRVHVRAGDGWSARPSDFAGDARNRAHVFIGEGAGGREVDCFVVPATVLAAELRTNRAWPGKGVAALERYREAWQLLGLARKNSSRSAPVVSPSSPSL